MRLTRYFLPVLKETPAEAQIVSHRLMLRAGMIRQASAGIYSWLPFGYKVLRRIEQIVHEEQQFAGAIPLLMPTIQSADLWRESGRYDDYGAEMLRITDRHGRDMLYGPTNEEQITEMFRAYCGSYRDVPKMLYHIQWKFRDEIRPRFGVMRGREFLMKDAYSFDLDGDAAIHAYNQQFAAYLRTFERMGLKAVPMLADSGPIGGDHCHEFLILAETGESGIFVDRAVIDMRLGDRAIDWDSRDQLKGIFEDWTAPYARTDETHDEAAFHAGVPEDRRVEARGIEVGHIFYFGTKYSEPLQALVTSPDGEKVPVHMGSYGVGGQPAGRRADRGQPRRGRDHLARKRDAISCRLGQSAQGDEASDAACGEIYSELIRSGLDVLYDDREARAGDKFATMDLIGLPWRITVGPRGLKKGTVELTCRRTAETEEVSPQAATDRLFQIYRGA